MKIHTVAGRWHRDVAIWLVVLGACWPGVGAQDKCTTVIVGRLATADGSVLVAHNEDWGQYEVPLRWNPREKHPVGATVKLRDGQELAQVEETFAFLWPAALCNGINEFQVAITDNTGSCRPELYQKVRGIEMQELVQLTLQRCRTAREAVQMMGRLIDQHGYLSVDGPNGDMFSVADPTEGWWIEVTTAGPWVAQRVPDDSFVVIANRYRIGEIDAQDATRFLVSSNLVDLARSRGWYDPVQGLFNFARAYGQPLDAKAVYSTRREWRGNRRLAGRPLEGEPLFVRPDKKLTPRDLMALLRDHYEGTEYELPGAGENGSPHRTSERTICVMKTDASTVAQLRGWLPPDLGGLLWFAAGTPCSSGYMPWYLGSREVPQPFARVSDQFTRESAFWVFNDLENLVDQYYSDRGVARDKPRAIELAARFWTSFEDETFASQAAVEKTAQALWEQDASVARAFLSRYSSGLALRAFMAAQELADTLRTTHYR